MKPYPTLGCFGKLPIHSDFIRYNAAGIGIQKLDEWVQEGIHVSRSKLGSAWDEAFSQSASRRFVFTVEEEKSLWVGLWVPSRDRGGRRYPFFLFLQIAQSAFSIPIYFAPLAFSAFFDRAVTMAQTGWHERELKSFLSALDQWDVQPPENLPSVQQGYLEQVQKRTTRNFPLFENFPNPTGRWVRNNLMDVLASQSTENMSGLGLKLPLFLKDQTEGYDLPFWFDWMTRQINPVPKHAIFFWHRGGDVEKPYLLHFARWPSPKSFLFMLQPNYETDLWYDFTSTGSEGKEGSGNEAMSEDLWERDNLSLAEFLESIARNR